MTREELVKTLEEFGLEKTDAELYLGLLQAGPVTVGSISSRLEIDRGKAYRSLSRLRNLGLVSTTFSNPTICNAIEPEEALNTIIQKREDEITTMQKLASKIAKDLKNVKNETKLNEVSSFSIIQGRSNIYARIGKMIQQAKNPIFIVTTVEDILRMYHTSIPEKIALCKKNGIPVKILTHTNSENLYPLIDRLNASETRIGKLPSKSRIIVEEQRQLIMSGSIKETMDLNDDSDSILYTNSSEMIQNMHSLCNHLWKKSRSLKMIAKK